MKAHASILRPALSLASAALLLGAASCAKLEQKVPEQRQEITFQTVTGPKPKSGSSTEPDTREEQTSPQTKASPAVFPTTSRFRSYAYYLEYPESWDLYYSHYYNGDHWPLFRDNAKLHLDNVEIAHSDIDGQWRAASGERHYWPLTGQLTFFSWTDGTASPAIESNAAGTTSVSCSTEKGITFTDFSITANRNKDLLVADVSKDNYTGSHSYHHNGVPTIFRHILCKFEFDAGLGETDPDNEYYLTRIEFTDLCRQATFYQIYDLIDFKEIGDWSTNASDYGTVVLFDGNMPVTNHEGEDPVDLSAGYTILLPQYIGGNANLETKKIIIYYTIYDTVHGVYTHKTKEAPLSTLYGANFHYGTKYSLDITFGNTEVFWAPGVEGWVVEEKDWFISRD